MKIPKKFKLFGSTVKVVFDNKRMDDVDAFGLYEYPLQTITLANKDRLDEISEDRITETFYHERTHAILLALGYKELNKDEQFVDLFSKALRQCDETASF